MLSQHIPRGGMSSSTIKITIVLSLSFSDRHRAVATLWQVTFLIFLEIVSERSLQREIADFKLFCHVEWRKLAIFVNMPFKFV